MYVHVPAMRGQMGSRTYYACLMPLSAIPNLFKFTDWADFTPEDREQRVLNLRRVPDLANYMLENEDDYLFASITASYKSEPIYSEVQADGDASIGILKLKLGDELIINDGQHRCAGIAQALKQNPALGDHTISILLFPYESRERVQQMFSDLNRFVVKTSKSIDILYDRRDPISIATMFALDKVPVFKELTEKENISLKAKDTKLFTLAAFYDANVELLRGQDDDAEENAKRLVEFWNAVAEHMPDWTAVLTRHKTSNELRAAKISAHSTVLRALGGIGAELMKESDWKNRLAGLEHIDWSKKNADWDNVCIVANSVVSNRQARAATKAYIKSKLGMHLTEGEQRQQFLAAAE
ncbi:MAG TPA: DNA sulfur modification protein DndB [Stellaceae bacterium]|nr:DNA sulfur modification protein DndB [Stellaceae bacterium]